jgi:hypothetical protein
VSATGGALLGYGVRARQYPALGRNDGSAGVVPASGAQLKLGAKNTSPGSADG